MKVKTYGVSGLSEWHGRIKAGSIEVSVSFVGGTASPSGAQPAYYMTKDPIVQFVIENSKEFKSGFISLIMQSELPGDHPRMAKHKKEVVEDVHESDDEEQIHTDEEQASVDRDNLTVVEVPDIVEAREYLKEHFDPALTASKLRSKSAVDAYAKEHGIKFVYSE